ncbi:acyltransferase domain-containing protein [Nostoc sp. FACHB-892]|uniref:type I polyketide synthase n=1 Tax=Nostoc sp. FACHB-892 TaxID=2692843 RepID=UPI001682BE5C|nr:type I polyketide synthase [Nostoc sp. FACHB-892]MBD2729713.1 acyltransferase domain-containing protein [Nostoc sp. FACHB-892]
MSASRIELALAQVSDELKKCEVFLEKLIMFSKNAELKSVPIKTMNMNKKLQHSPIAIIGMASIFPKARNLQEYWENIVKKLDCITDVPLSRWNTKDYYDPNPKAPEKTYSKRGGFIPDVDFDPIEFGLPPNILEVTDVSQLLGLVVAKEALEDAGYGKGQEFDRETTGVVLGAAQASQLSFSLDARLHYPIWKKVLKSSGLSDEDIQKIVDKIKSAYVQWDENAFPGILANVVAGRIANRLNLGGINCVVDAACASTFAALKMAISELVEHRCNMMLTGGVDTNNSINTYMCFSKTPAISPTGNIKPFDAESNGMIVSEGIGMVVLKRLKDAERDNDKIYAVIKGIGTSSDGRYKSIYAPRQAGQVTALRRAYEDAGFAPTNVGLIEAHGTGTITGDLTEFAALKEFFGEQDSRTQHIALGSVKSQIGHTKAAAGAASLIKTALALYHKILPPTINITQPNTTLNIKNSPFYLNTETRPWIRTEGEPPRRAGTSSFGFGGTNYHIVLEEYEAEQNRPYRLHSNPSEVLLLAQTPAQLLTTCEEILAQLQSEAGDRHYAELVEVCKTQEIPPVAARVGFVAESKAEVCKFLQITIDLLKNKTSASSWEHPQGVYYRQTGLELAGKVVALFSGQGSQYLNMGRELVINFPEVRRICAYMDSLLLKDNLPPLSETVYPHPVFEEAEKNAQVAALQRTEYAQPAIGMLSAGLYKILQQAGFTADFVAGHSFGELTALWAADVLSDKDYCFLAKARGQAMAVPQDPGYDAGTMLAVKEDAVKVEAVLKHFPRVVIANLNSPRQVVLAGATAEITKVRQTLQEQGSTAILLPVAAAFHTPLIAFAKDAFVTAVKRVTFSDPKIPVYTNVTGKQYPQEPAAIQRILENHLLNSVLFQQEIENIYAAGGYCFVEFGPKGILTNLVKNILGDRPHLAIALNPSSQKDSDRSLREAVVQLRVAGLPLKNLDPYQTPQAIPAIEHKQRLKVRLSCTNYVSEKSKMAFEQALRDGHKVKLLETKSVEMAATDPQQTPSMPVTSTILEKNGHNENHPAESPTMSTPTHMTNSLSQEQLQVTSKRVLPLPVSESKMPTLPDKDTVNYQRALESLEYLLAQFQQHQSDRLQLHEQYLNHQMEYMKTFSHLMQQQNSLLANNTSIDAAQIKPVGMDSLERSMVQFHAHHNETLRIHEQYLQYQAEYTKNFFHQVIHQEYSKLIRGEETHQPVESSQTMISREDEFSTPTLPADLLSTEKASSNGKQEQVQALETTVAKEDSPVPASSNIWDNLELVAKNGLTPTVEDRVILPATQQETNLDLVANNSSTPVQASIAVSTQTEPTVTVVTSTTVEPTGSQALTQPVEIDLADLGDNLLAMTSDKTGYPVEMLELDMDMEADLGIDSIKRVEILGAMQELYPDLPKPNLEELAEKRTIRQIVEYIQSLTQSVIPIEVANDVTKATNFAPIVPPTATVITQPEPVASNDLTLVQETVAISTTIEATASEALTQPVEIDLADLGDNLLAMTSDKTGYPVEMLELDMDMEADLGIDSIKRVEILGAMQELYPDLPKPNLEELAEKRTIRQIVEYLQQVAAGEKKKLADPSDNQQFNLNHNIVRSPVKLRSLPKPDFLEFTLPKGYISLLTDDGSPTTSKLAESLTEKDWKVVVLSFPKSLIPQSSPLPAGVNRVVLADLSEEHLQQQLAAIATNYGAIGAFIHINPVFEATRNGSIHYLEVEKAIVKHVFFMAKQLKKSLKEAAHDGRSCFCTIARLDGSFGLEHKVNFGAISAGLLGLTKSLNWEWQKVFCRAIDLSPAIDAEQSADHIIAELHDPNLYITEVAYGSQGRVTLISTADSEHHWGF